MSEEVKRYDIEWNGLGEAWMGHDSDGEYVTIDDYAALRAKLVKAVIEIAERAEYASTEAIIEHVWNVYGIRLRWTGDGFEEDKG